MNDVRWISGLEFAVEIGSDPRTVYRLFKQGQLKGIGDNWKNLRLIDPGPKWAAHYRQQNLDYFKFITIFELADVLGVTYWTMKQRIRRERLKKRGAPGPKATKIKKALYFSRVEVRKYAAMQEKVYRRPDYRNKQPGQKVYKHSAVIVRWLKHWLATREISGDTIDALIREVTYVPEPDRSRLAKELWDCFDKVNDLLAEAYKLSKTT